MKCPSCRTVNVAGTPLCRRCGATLPMHDTGFSIEPDGDERPGTTTRTKEVVHSTSRLVSQGTAPLDDLPAQLAWVADVRDLVAGGRKIEAVKVVRQQTGMGLKEAKDAVEAIAQGKPVTLTSTRVVGEPKSLDAVVSALRAGDQEAAMRAYCEETGASFDEAQAVIEALRKGPATIGVTVSGTWVVMLLLTVVIMVGGLVAVLYALR